MKGLRIALVALLSLTHGVELGHADPATGAYHITMPKRPLAAGENLNVSLEPPPPGGTSVYWRNAIGLDGRRTTDDARHAVYIAPLVIAPGVLSAELRVDLSGIEVGRITVVESVPLVPGSAPGAEECLGPGQSFSPESGDILPEDGQYVYGVATEIVRASDPRYPKAAAARRLTGSVSVRSLVCQTGTVIAAHISTRYDDDHQPIDDEPMLADAALQIARGLILNPSAWNQEGRASWIHVHVRFEQ